MDTFLRDGPKKASDLVPLSESAVRSMARRIGLYGPKKVRPIGRDYFLERLDELEEEEDSYAEAVNKVLIEWAPKAISQERGLEEPTMTTHRLLIGTKKPRRRGT